MTASKRALGKGLNALIGPGLPQSEGESTGGIMEVDINRIEPNKQQPRRYFDEDTLRELAASISAHGIIQPLILKEEDGYYSIIAGERRWRAARMAKLSSVPAIIKDYTETETLQIALIENIQRQDLNPIEEAICYKKLIDDFFFSQDDVAAKVGKSRNAISYSVNLLNLEGRVQDYIIEGKLTPGHGRVLLGVKDEEAQFNIAKKIVEEDLSVRFTEKLVKAYSERKQLQDEEPNTITETKAEPAFHTVESILKTILGTKVSIKDGKKKGKIEIEYYSHDELDRILLLLKRIEDHNDQE